MGRFLFPDEYISSTYSIDFDKYYKNGIRAIFFDIDNTLVMHDAPADKRAEKLIRGLLDKGFKVYFISNNEEPRVRDFAAITGGNYVYKAGKPKPDGFYEAMKQSGLKRKEVLFIGDQLFTDIWGANNARIRNILVGRISAREPYYIHLKRILEMPFRLIIRLLNKRRDAI